MKRNRKATSFFKQKSYVIAAVLMLVAAFGMTGVYVSEQVGEKKQQEELQAKKEAEKRKTAEKKAKEEEDSKAVDQIILPENTDFMDEPNAIASKEEEPDVPKNPEEAKTEENQPEEEPAQETSATPTMPELHFNAETDLGWPMEGNVILGYSMDQTVYFATLDQYKYNPAIIIQGNVNDKVQSVAAGKISNIETNEETGCTVTVDLGDGYSAVYGQLKEVSCHAGDYIDAGATIGYISEPTKYYSVEGPNLYFQLLKDNASVDPMEYLQ